MNIPKARICRPRLPQEVYSLIDLAEEKMTGTQSSIGVGDIRIVGIEPDGFFELRHCRLRLSQKHQRQTKLMKGAAIVVVEGYSCLVLDPRFSQSVLKSAEDPQREMRHRAARVALEGFKEQQFGARLILLDRAAPPIG